MKYNYECMFSRENQKDVTMGNQQERFDLDLAWLAGIIEGEGWISLTVVKSLKRSGKNYPAFVPNIGVVNTDEILMNKVKEIWNKLELTYRKQEIEAYTGTDGVSRKKKWQISVCSKQNVLKLARAIMPFMHGQKRQRIEKLFEFFEVREKKPKSGPNSIYGLEEYLIYKSLYSYRGKSRSKILNDLTLDEKIRNFEDKV